jgi:hypothetical protein
MTSRTFLCAASLLVAISLSSLADELRPPGALTAKDVLERMAKVHAGCKSYRDSGVVKTAFLTKQDGPGGNTEEIPFATAFVRPDRFRFEHKVRQGNGKEARHIVWRKGTDVRTWWEVSKKVHNLESLSQAVAEATGVSAGAAHTISQLLLPNEIDGWSLTDMKEAKRIDDGKLDGAPCYRIQGKDGSGNPMTLWVDQKTFLVRRIDTEMTFTHFRTKRTATYQPAIDEEVPETLLEFDVPSGAAAPEEGSKPGWQVRDWVILGVSACVALALLGVAARWLKNRKRREDPASA